MDDVTKLMWTKIGALAILFTITLGFGSVPLCIFKRGNDNARISSRLFSILNCFAGGIFFGLCLLDLLPDVIESFEDTLDKDVKFPFAELSVACGLILVLVVEQFFHAIQAPSNRKSNNEEERASLSSNSTHGRNFGTFNGPESGQIASDRRALVGEDEEPEDPSSGHIRDNSPTHVNRAVGDTAQEGAIPQVDHVDQDQNQSHDVISTDTNGHIDNSHVMHSPSAFRSILLLGALSFHSVLEGIAVGIQSTPNKVWTLLLAISIHKSVISFSLGINFLSTMKKLNSFLCQAFFAIMSPIGIALGLVIVSQVDEFSSSIWQGILQGAATGTFLYVTFFELLPHEIEGPRDKVWKVLFILVGFGVSAGLITYEKLQE